MNCANRGLFVCLSPGGKKMKQQDTFDSSIFPIFCSRGRSWRMGWKEEESISLSCLCIWVVTIIKEKHTGQIVLIVIVYTSCFYLPSLVSQSLQCEPVFISCWITGIFFQAGPSHLGHLDQPIILLFSSSPARFSRVTFFLLLQFLLLGAALQTAGLGELENRRHSEKCQWKVLFFNLLVSICFLAVLLPLWPPT